MDDRIDLKDGELHRLLAGSPPADDGTREGLAQFARELRGTYLASPSEATQARHLAAITELARSLDNHSESVRTEPAPARPRQRRSSRRKLMLSSRPIARAAQAAACAVSLVFATAGLAVAGVELPAPANEAFEKVGLSLPNQAGGDGGGSPAPAPERASDVRGVIDATAPGDRDCEFGQAVAGAARGSALPTQAQAACGRGEDADRGAQAKNEGRTRHDGQARNGGQATTGGGDSMGNSEPAAGRSFGQETSQGAKGLDDATPEQRRQFGQDTSERAQELGADPPAPPAPPTDTPAPPAPQGGPETGQSQSEAGQATGDQASGGRKP